jgi:Tol biopolymer transport system component
MKAKTWSKKLIQGLIFLALLLCSAQTAFAQTTTLRANGKITFTSNRDGNREIYIMNADGTNQVRLTDNSVVDDHPTWSPDGTKIAFVSESTTGGRAIFTINPDGTGKTQITPVSYVDQYSAWPYWIWTDFYSMDWSPDGAQIVFQDNYDLVIVNADGTNRHAITDGTSYDLEPAWSPDGSKILFSRDLTYDQLYFGRLSIVNVDGSNPQFLSGWQWQAYAPKWSPSGDKLLYVIEYTDDDPTSVITISNADGSNPQLFEGRDDIYEHQYRNKPSWSPDGTKILFDKVNYETGYPGDLEIYVRNIDGTGLVQITNTNGWNFNPSWQPASAAACPNPIDCPDFFIRQQYRDFLGREPDANGFEDWMATLTECSNGGFGEFDNPQCDRVHVSAGFVQSNEFQGRGYWILRFGYVGLNRSIGSVRSSATYDEFTPALAQVGGSNSPAEEDAAKVTYANAFVQRPDFLALFPPSMTASQYVNGLESNAQVSLPNKQALIDALNAGTMTRADVLRNVVESQVVFDKYIIPAFVTMEYFGYLHRDPDLIGYQNWVNTLTGEPNNYRHMIFGFIYSTEYRGRFGAP